MGLLLSFWSLFDILVCFITFENDVFNSLYCKVDVCIKPYCHCAGVGSK